MTALLITTFCVCYIAFNLGYTMDMYEQRRYPTTAWRVAVVFILFTLFMPLIFVAAIGANFHSYIENRL